MLKMLKHFGCKPWRPKPQLFFVRYHGRKKNALGFWHSFANASVNHPRKLFQHYCPTHFAFFLPLFILEMWSTPTPTHQHTTGATMSQLMPAMVGSGRSLSSSSMTSWLKADCAPSLQSKPRRELHPYHWNILKLGVPIFTLKLNCLHENIATT